MGNQYRATENQILGVLTDEKVDLLLSGLISLEGALNALKQPVPPALSELKNGLIGTRQKPVEKHKPTISTKEAAELLKCSARHVRYLAKAGRIHLLVQGTVGRGRSSLYDAQTVEAYAVDRQRKEAR